MSVTVPGAERTRVESFGQLEDGLRQASDWYLWGPYLSERQWGTVREDYSADGDAWSYLPHDHARSRAYRWGEDGMAGFCDVEQRLCLALALWNGRDPILKERMFGLTGAQANHGEDVKEYWWYLDAVPSHAWNRWRYHYPQAGVPVRRPHRRERATGQARRRVRVARHRCVRRRPLLDRRGRLRQGRSDRSRDDRAGHERRSGGRDAARATDGVVPEHVGVGRRRARSGAAWPARRCHRHRASLPRRPRAVGRARPGRLGADRPVLRERDERPAALRVDIENAVPEGRDQRPRRRRARHGQPGPARHQGGALVPAPCRPGCHSRGAAPAAAGGIRAGEPATALGVDARRDPGASRRQEADEFYSELAPAGTLRGRGPSDAPGLRGHAVEQAAVLLRRPDAGSMATRRSRPRRRIDATGETAAGRTSRRSTSCRCPTSGSTRGSRRGTWASTASLWPTSTRRSPSTSWCCCAVSGSSTRPGRCPPTSGTSATSTRPCRPGRRSRCSPSTAVGTSTS